MGNVEAMDQKQAILTNPFQVYLNGAFFTGVALDSSVLLSTKNYYRETQKTVVDTLKKSDEGWNYRDLENKPRELYPVKGETLALVPDCFATKGGEALNAEVQRHVDNAKVRAEATGLDSITVDSVDIDFFDSAFGVLAVMLHVTPRKGLGAAKARRSIDSLCSVLEDDKTLNLPLESAIREFEEGIDAHFRVDGEDGSIRGLLHSPWVHDDGMEPAPIPKHSNGKPVDDPNHPEKSTPEEERRLGPSRPAELFWIHRTYILASAGWGEADEAIAELLPEIRAEKGTPSGDTSLVAGLGSSAVKVPTFEALAGDPFKNLLMLMDLQWAYIATVIEIDRTLFRRLNYIRSKEQREEFERESEEVLALYHRVRLFRAALESFLIDLGGESRRAWERMAEVQSLRQFEATLDDKLSALRETCESSLAKLSREREKSSRVTETNIARTLYVFTAFSVVASLIAITTFPLAKDLEAAPVTVRVAVIFVAGLTVGAVAFRAWARRDPPIT